MKNVLQISFAGKMAVFLFVLVATVSWQPDKNGKQVKAPQSTAQTPYRQNPPILIKLTFR